MTNPHTNIPSGYKPSPLGIIPEDWEVKRLGDLCFDIFSGSNKTRIDSGKYTVYGSTGIIGKTDEYKYEGERILVARVGAHAGQVSIASGKYDVSDNTIIVENQDCYSLYFAYQYLIASNLNKMVFGSGQPLITAGMLKRMFVVYPPFEEQLKINNVLQLWDIAIAKQTVLIEQLALRKRGLMQQLLTGKKRLKGFGGEWEKIKFKEIFQRKTQIVNDSSNVQVLSVTKEGIVSQKEYFNKEVASDDTSKYLLVEKGDLAMSGLNFWMGSCHILTQYEKGIISPAYKVFSIRDGFSIEYIVNFVQSYNFKSSLLGSSVIGASIVRRNLDLEMLEEWTYLLPSLPEQKAISDILTYADKEIEIQKQKLAAMQEQKKGLMQVLLTGERRIRK